MKTENRPSPNKDLPYLNTENIPRRSYTAPIPKDELSDGTGRFVPAKNSFAILDPPRTTALMALGLHDNALDRLNTQLAELKANLDPVLRPSPPDNPGICGATGTGVPLINNIENATTRVHEMANLVEDLNARIAL